MWGLINISGGYLEDYLEDALTDALAGVKEEIAQGHCGAKRSRSTPRNGLDFCYKIAFSPPRFSFKTQPGHRKIIRFATNGLGFQ